MYVGDVNATPADAVEGADFMEVPFMLMETAPADYNSSAGTAQMAVHDHGTTVTLRLYNLLPNTDYMSHVHEEPCSTGGGAHYRFDPGRGGTAAKRNSHRLYHRRRRYRLHDRRESQPANQVDETAHSVIVHSDGIALLCADLQ